MITAMNNKSTPLGLTKGKSSYSPKTTALLNMDVGVFIYYMSFTFFLIGNCIAATTAENVAGVKLGLQICAIALLFLKILLERIRPKQVAICIVITGIFAYSGVISSNFTLLWGWLFICCGLGIRLKSLAKIALVVFVLSTILTIFLASIGVLASLEFHRSGSTLTRYALGFTHPNSLALRGVEITVALLLIRYQRYTFFDCFYVLVAAVLVWAVTNSRTASLCIVFAFVFALLICSDFVQRHKQGFLCFCLALFLFEIIFSVSWAVLGPEANSIYAGLNDLLSGRIYYAHYYFDHFGVKLFGQNLENVTVYAELGYYFQGLLIDNAYCNVLINNGFVPFMALMLLLLRSYLEMIRQGACSSLLLGLVVLGFLGLSEASAFNFYTAYVLIALCPPFFDRPVLFAEGDS